MTLQVPTPDQAQQPPPGGSPSTTSSPNGQPSSTPSTTVDPGQTQTGSPSSGAAPAAGEPPVPLTPEQQAAAAHAAEQAEIANRIATRRAQRATAAGQPPPQQQQPQGQQQQQPQDGGVPQVDPRVAAAFVDLQQKVQRYEQLVNGLREDPLGILARIGIDTRQLIQRAATTGQERQTNAEVEGLKAHIAKLEQRLDGGIKQITDRYNTDLEHVRKIEIDERAMQVTQAADPQKHWAFLHRFQGRNDEIMQGAVEFLETKRELAKERGVKHPERITCTFDEVVNYLNEEALRELRPQIETLAPRMGYSKAVQDAIDAAQGTGDAGAPLARSALGSNGAGMKPPLDISKLPPEQQHEAMAEAARAVRAKSKPKKR